MIVTANIVHLYAPWVHSLKEKRMMARSLQKKLQNRFNISVIELDGQDIHQTLILGVAHISLDNAQADRLEEQIYQFIVNNSEAEIVSFERERR